jgi:hypothetical protein
MNSNSVHLGPTTELPDRILKGDHQRIILAKVESNWPSSLRGKKLKFHPPFLLFVEEYNICASSCIFFLKDSSCFVLRQVVLCIIYVL